MQLEQNWSDIKKLFAQSFSSSFHYAVGTVNENGEPHVTPIGSRILKEPGHGFFFEEFTRHLTRNLQQNKQVCVLAVNSSRWFWVKSLLGGRFSSPPAIRLYGTVGQTREATEEEIGLWHHKVRRVRRSKGYALIWKGMKFVRDIRFSRAEPVHIGEMTRGLWESMESLEKSTT